VRGTLQARLAIAAVAALVAWAAVATLARAQPAQVDALSVTGAVRLASDHDGTAALLADHLVPGGSASGTVRLANTGDADGLVELAQTGVTDVPGAGGGRLSQALRLRVEDVTAGAPVVLSDGPLTGLTQLPIGRLVAGRTRVLRLTATLPATSGNTLQGASVRMDWTWGAVSVAHVPTATPAPTVTPTPTVVPTPTPAPGGGTPVPAAPVLSLSAPRRQRVARSRVNLSARCAIACTVRFGAKLQTAPMGGKRAQTLLARKVLRRAKATRLRAGARRTVRLRLTPRAARRAAAALNPKRGASLYVTARVTSARGRQVVTRRLVLRR
jgi:hypothetical protein